MFYKERSISEQIEKHLPNKRHTIISGARQVGKTSLLKHLYGRLKKEGKPAFFISFEDPGILAHIDLHPKNIFDFINVEPVPVLKGKAEQRIILFIDEVQYAKDPTNFLKLIYDLYEGNVKIVATGSSAFYIDSKFKDSLAGRKKIFNLYPLSFDEYLFFQGANDLKKEIADMKAKPSYQSLEQDRLRRFFYNYLTYGGYPAVVLEPDEEEKKEMLAELKNAYIRRDMAEANIQKSEKFLHIFRLLADQIGNLANKNELSDTLGINFNTVEHYLYILQKCHHIHFVKPFFRNIRKELTKMPKIYFNDLGLRNSLLNRFTKISERSDKGALLENYFFCQARHIYGLDQLFFWRTTSKQEIDFVIEKEYEKGKAWEVKWNARHFKINKYKRFLEAYPGFELECFSEEHFWVI
ncbi:MAG TPA: ATP-binding protein [Bacteroidetes bacterium]|nr:ATP-binding protein [Bacteroidota bacterium]